MLLLRERLSPCALWCRFCPNAIWPWDRTPVQDEAVLARVLAELQVHLASVTTPSVTLVSADILEYPRLFDLLDAVVAAGRDAVLNTPGLRLADVDFTARLAKYPVVLDLTWLSNSPGGYANMAGNPDAHDRIRAGIATARAAGIPTKVSVVVTSDNVGELDALIERVHREFGSPRVDLRLFYPDLPTAPPDYFKLHPAFEDIEAALRRLDATAPEPPIEIDLGNAPHCQLDLRGLTHLRVATQLHQSHQNTYGTEGLPVCLSCEARHRCVRLPESYVRHHRIRRPDGALFADNLSRAQARATTRAGGDPSTG